jgi:hypothetical protein
MSERRRLLAVAVMRIRASLDTCLAAKGVTEASTARLESLRSRTFGLERERSRRPRPDSYEVIQEDLGRLYRVERELAVECAPTAPFDRALILIGRRHDLEPGP